MIREIIIYERGNKKYTLSIFHLDIFCVNEFYLLQNFETYLPCFKLRISLSLETGKLHLHSLVVVSCRRHRC